MKFSALLVAFAPAVLALPTAGSSEAGLSKRQDIKTVTDQLLFSTSLSDFVRRRNAQDPRTLDWTSDGCTSAPDNPFGFPFLPACYRHDFGYQNYRIQSRFKQSAKLTIDNKFRSDLYFQCGSVTAKQACNALADVYYAAVRAFGGGDATPGKRDQSQEELIEEYAAKLVIYHQAVKEAQEKGLLPILE